jgi:hypothetical protein
MGTGLAVVTKSSLYKWNEMWYYKSMNDLYDISDRFSALKSSVFAHTVINIIQDKSQSADVSPSQLSQLAPGVLASLARRNVVPYHLGYAASDAASINTGELSPALGGAWIWREIIAALMIDEDPAERVHALGLPGAVADTVGSYEALEKGVKKRNILGVLIDLPVEVEWCAHQWLHALQLPRQSERIADYISGLV